MKKRILFVDDEPNILDGLRRMLRPMRHEWEMAFAESGKNALEILAKESFDVVISDMRMPQMDGATLLAEIKKRHPQIVRFVLSGQSDKETILRSVGPAHQFMSKPCDAEKIKVMVARACALRDILTNETLKTLVSQMGTIPSMPNLYLRLVDELQSAEPSIKKVAEIIEKDVGMSVKILQLVNSSFFGLRDHISSPAQAASLLGVDILRSLVLMVHVFSQLNKIKIPKFRILTLWDHSAAVGACSQMIAKIQRSEKVVTIDASTAGFLHDSGKLVLAVNMPEEYTKVLSLSKKENIPIWEAEKEIFQANHAEVGAYLLGLWGLPDSLVEAVAFHHNPSQCLSTTFTPLTCVHVANVLAYDTSSQTENKLLPRIDFEYLAELGFEHCYTQWSEGCKKILKGN